MTDMEQKNILGEILFPMVSRYCVNKTNPPKVTGMLIDFSVMNVREVIDLLE